MHFNFQGGGDIEKLAIEEALEKALRDTAFEKKEERQRRFPESFFNIYREHYDALS